MRAETLALEQVALICGVSVARVRNWVKKKGLRTRVSASNEERVHRDDLIEFLVQYNMPIPQCIIPFNAKKILFIFSDEVLNDIYVQFLMRFFSKLKKEANFIVDCVSYGPTAKMKIMVFGPDLVILDMTDAEREASEIGRFISETEEFRSIKVVAVARNMVYKRNEEAMATVGIDAILPRSIEIRPMIERIRRLF